MKKSLQILILGILVVLASCSQTSAARKKKSISTKPVLIESYRVITYPGRKDALTEKSYAISLQWKSKKSPLSFWWRGDSGWMNCRVARYPGKGHALPEAQGNISLEDIKYDDKLTIIPMPGGRFPIPSFVTDDITNTLYYQTDEHTYVPVKVKHFTTVERAMP